jgi:hypothetical protein
MVDQSVQIRRPIASFLATMPAGLRLVVVRGDQACVERLDERLLLRLRVTHPRSVSRQRA